jgi:hypothetical protein
MYIMLRVASSPFHRLRRFHHHPLRQTRGYNQHSAGNIRSRQVRRDGGKMGLGQVNSSLTYSSKADVPQPAKTEMPAPAKLDIPLLVEV